MAGRATKLCFAPTSRPSTSFVAASKDVDARHKAGHDGGEDRRKSWCVIRHRLRQTEGRVMAGRATKLCFAPTSRPSTSFVAGPRTCMPGTRPGMTSGEVSRSITELPLRLLNVASMRPSWPAEAMKRCFARTFQPPSVMAGLVPAIHVLCRWSKHVDARHKARHDGVAIRIALLLT